MSGTGMAVTMVALGIYLEVGDGNSDLSWLPLLLILGYIVSTGNSFSRFCSTASYLNDFPPI
jgi:hypothetical protein